jgi:putative RecB family exonuclease
MLVDELITGVNLDLVWKDTWERVKTAHSASTGQEEALWKTAGRATKENPDKENGAWWYTNGRLMLDSWIKFRTGELGWQIWEAPNGTPAIEIGMNVEVGGVPVQMGIDRVMVTPAGELVILDLKTGQRTPSSDLQLAFYALGMSKMFGVRPQYGAYWMARQGITSPLIDLDFYTDDMIEEIIVKFDTARKAELFLPNYSHCKMCGFTTICKYNKEGK